MPPRRRSRPHSFEDKLSSEKSRLQAEAAKFPDGPSKERVLNKIRQIDATARMGEWLSTPGAEFSE